MPLTLAQADFDDDGEPELVTGAATSPGAGKDRNICSWSNELRAGNK